MRPIGSPGTRAANAVANPPPQPAPQAAVEQLPSDREVYFSTSKAAMAPSFGNDDRPDAGPEAPDAH
ncbi:MAG: hypothetical protein U1F43_33560 [Myxococcota bacterium]